MTNIIIIGDLVCTNNGHDVVIGLTLDDKVILERRGLSDETHFDVIGHVWSSMERLADTTLPSVTLYGAE